MIRAAVLAILGAGPAFAAGMDDVARTCRAPEVAPGPLTDQMVAAGWTLEEGDAAPSVAAMVAAHAWGAPSPFGGMDPAAARDGLVRTLSAGDGILLTAEGRIAILTVTPGQDGVPVLTCWYAGPEEARTDQIFGEMSPETLPGDVIAARQRTTFAHGGVDAGDVVETITRNPSADLPDGFHGVRSFPQ
ncbi:hypothetical protein [Wenxinia saemankumensis]|uniref:Uncharacterized protein n=1 Tax=Wenxinia saemankumensis TaxID=1447782 RepID=A0A1M6EMF6_9RHOB|nr:hypothetical protein [Wenxinia saemankumensis]SHI86596.1 hypothetical protein SAMN05444417_2070 [Wenxinia saemankumensis]